MKYLIKFSSIQKKYQLTE